MSTFKQCTYNTITNSGEAINGRLLYSQLDGGNQSQPVYFGLKDDTTWVGKLSTKGSSSFYLATDTTGCSAEVKDSTYTPTTADANTAREIWLSIPKATAARKIVFSYNGTTVLTVNQNVTSKTKYNIIIASPYWYNISNDYIRGVTYYLYMDNAYDESYIARSGGNGVNLSVYNYTDFYMCFIDQELNGSNMIYNNQTINDLVQKYNLTYVSGDQYIFDTAATSALICSFPQGMYDSE